MRTAESEAGPQRIVGKYTTHSDALAKTGLANPGANYAIGGTLGLRVAW